VTKRYSDINMLDALYKAARQYPGGIEQLAARMQKDVGVLYKKLQPSVDTHHTNVEEFDDIVEYLDETKPEAADLAIGAFLWRHNRVAVRLPLVDAPVNANALLNHVLAVLDDEGKLAADLGAALRDTNAIDDRDYEAIEKDLQMCIGALMLLRAEVKEKHKRDTGRDR
jgi:hypothetical protein